LRGRLQPSNGLSSRSVHATRVICLRNGGRALLNGIQSPVAGPGSCAEALFRADVPERYLPVSAIQTEQAIAAFRYVGGVPLNVLIDGLREVAPRISARPLADRKTSRCGRRSKLNAGRHLCLDAAE
jgi:hypothetical protein